MSKKPLITVLMPVYNCEAYAGAAIESVIKQTYTYFEFLIIDDASEDETLQIIKRYTDSRIQLIEKPENTGYTNSLNYGLSIAKGKYIARMDGDDISLPNRLELQVTYMEQYPDVVACGAFYKVIGTDVIKTYPSSHEAIKIALLENTCFAHPSVMLRKAVLDTHRISYDVTKEPAEDYALWVTLLKYGKLHNIDEVLLHYRVHEQQVSQQRRTVQLESKLSTRIALLAYLLPNETETHNRLLKLVLLLQIIPYQDLVSFLKLKDAYIAANKSQQFIKVNSFNAYMNAISRSILKSYFLKRRQFSLILFKQYLTLHKNYGFKLPYKTVCILFVKGLIWYKAKPEIEKTIVL